MEKKILFVFDFDHTILKENSDIIILKLLSDLALNKLKEKQHESENWAYHMQNVYKSMKEENIQLKHIEDVVSNMEFNPGFTELFDFMKNNQKYFETLIISGANTLFLKWVLGKNNLTELFPVSYSNIAVPNDDDLINIRPYHSHNCDSCDKSQCKRIILKEFLQMKKEINVLYTNLIFVGDGLNDYCPATFFKEEDILFPRVDFPLHKKLYKNGFLEKLKCQVHVWKDGYKIIEVVKKLI